MRERLESRPQLLVDSLEALPVGELRDDRGRFGLEDFLVEVVDRPGTAQDRAVFRAEHSGDAHHVTLGRHGDEWIREAIEPAPR